MKQTTHFKPYKLKPIEILKISSAITYVKYDDKANTFTIYMPPVIETTICPTLPAIKRPTYNGAYIFAESFSEKVAIPPALGYSIDKKQM